eukprot:CAMPEP_0197524988 /NCGR_PEP_ID=MMETSP1318-20131121/10545_1 /TAXON_ID=552666 /ORGANISM="Partenskyella glossopodia, Strain RCC365" /LENGTH=139 /DNA_ID=CAMNT_0043078117 /DNA_START=29 /DNA_END=448 /DNA_ORIENTATION=+
MAAHYTPIGDQPQERKWSLNLSLALNALLVVLVVGMLFTQQSETRELGFGMVRSPMGATSFSRSTAFAPQASRTAVSASKKGDRLMVTLECTEAREMGKMPSRYTTVKNRKNTPERMEMMKYNKFLRRHTLHREIKKSK